MYGIFDSRPKHNQKPFLFTTYCGLYEPAIFDDKEKAEEVAAKMNSVTKLTTFIVREVK